MKSLPEKDHNRQYFFYENKYIYIFLAVERKKEL